MKDFRTFLRAIRVPRPSSAALLAALALWALAPAAAQSLADTEKKITLHKLANGWTFIIYERPVAPVFSFATYVDVGGAQEVPGITGLAHMFEHMAFKGTPNIGTNNYEGEKEVLAKVDEAYAALDAERRSSTAQPDKVKALEKAWKDRQEEADAFIVKNEFGEIVDRNGGIGLNASTSSDATVYVYSLPSNKTELWAFLESERFLQPVYREFYKERDVVKEERRLRTESSPQGRLIEQFISIAFSAHPYKQPVVGYMSDLNSFSREDAERFYRTYYVPSNIVTAVVGDVKAAELVPILERYFGRIPKGSPPPKVRTVEPPQTVEKTVRMPDPAQPAYFEGYHKGAVTDPDEQVFEVMGEILSTGRTSRFYRSMVRDAQIAINVGAGSGFPGDKYPNMFFISAIPSRGHTTDEVRDGVRAQLERLKTEDVTSEELARVKTREKAGLIRRFTTNNSLARNLAANQTIFGDWREMFRSVDKIDKVTKADIRRVAAKTFVETNRTVGILETVPARSSLGPESSSDARAQASTSNSPAQERRR